MKDALWLLRQNKKALMEFEFFYKLLCLAVFLPFFTFLFNLIMKVQGFSYLTAENIAVFLGKPLTLFLLLLLFIFLSLYYLSDISAILYILDCSRQGKTPSLVSTLRFSLSKAGHFLLPYNWPFLLAVLFLAPLIRLGTTTSFLGTISVPTFLFNLKDKILLFSLPLVVFLLVLFLLASHHLFLFHYGILDGRSFHRSARQSRYLVKGKAVSTLLRSLLGQVCLTFLYMLAALVGIFLLAKGFLLLPLPTARSLATSAIWVYLAILLFLLVTLATPWSMAIVSAAFYRLKEEKNEAISSPFVPEISLPKTRKALNIGEGALAVLALGALFLYVYLFDTGRISVNAEYLTSPEITAHRGASAAFPENTMAAFQGAVDLSADWIELDVTQSKDGQLFICHDQNLKRLTGLDKNARDLTYEEIQKLDAGSHFSPEFAGERMPLLSEVLAFAKEADIRLNIELKPTGKEAFPYETAVADLVYAYEMEERCVISSQNYESLEKVKAYAPELKTIYVMKIAYGSIAGMEAADGFSIHASFASRSRVISVHQAGKDLYVWTVNDAERIRQLTDLAIDNIITDNIPLAIEAVNTARSATLLEEYIQLVLGPSPEETAEIY